MLFYFRLRKAYGAASGIYAAQSVAGPKKPQEGTGKPWVGIYEVIG